MSFAYLFIISVCLFYTYTLFIQHVHNNMRYIMKLFTIKTMNRKKKISKTLKIKVIKAFLKILLILALLYVTAFFSSKILFLFRFLGINGNWWFLILLFSFSFLWKYIKKKYLAYREREKFTTKLTSGYFLNKKIK